MSVWQVQKLPSTTVLAEPVAWTQRSQSSDVGVEASPMQATVRTSMQSDGDRLRHRRESNSIDWDGTRLVPVTYTSSSRSQRTTYNLGSRRARNEIATVSPVRQVYQ